MLIVRINGIPIQEYMLSAELQQVREEMKNILENKTLSLDKKYKRLFKLMDPIPYMLLLPILSIFHTLLPDIAFAATTTTPNSPFSNGHGHDFVQALIPIIKLLQDFAIPVGMGFSIWGMIEWMMGNPAGKKRLQNSIIAFIAIFLIPYFFETVGSRLENLPM